MIIGSYGIATARTIFPLATSVTSDRHLAIGGCDCVELAREFGTPLYVYDEFTLRTRAREYVHSFNEAYPDSFVIYACKAFAGPMVLQILEQEGLGLDVVSGGELFAARYAGFPMGRIYFHGNNKSWDELEQALQWGVGHVVVDNFREIEMLTALTLETNKPQKVLLRVAPGVLAHTHDYITTGALDSKFGFTVATGHAELAVSQVKAFPTLELVGLHCHIGSQIFDLDPYLRAIEVVMSFAEQMQEIHGLRLHQFSPGGGFGVRYTEEEPKLAISQVAATIAAAVRDSAQKHNVGAPRLVVEPGRSIVAQAGVALYTVGAIKDIPQWRKYVAVDGGMADNIRPALYGARYEVVVANRVRDKDTETVTIAGKFCESGDALIKDVSLPSLLPGDLLAVPCSGAYNLAMASNYNMSLKPAVVLVRDGKATLMRRRQTYEDLLAGEATVETAGRSQAAAP